MKKMLLVLVSAVSSFGMYAQTSDAEAEAIVNLLGVRKTRLHFGNSMMSTRKKMWRWPNQESVCMRKQRLPMAL
jgi:hypothetical protein